MGDLMGHLEKLKPLALLLMRCALGIIFIFHGYPKLFGHTANTQQFFSHVGLPPSLVYVVGVLELFGGGLLILGLFTRLVGLLLTIEMGVAIWKVHLAHGILSVKDYEFPLTVAVAAFTLAAVGAGVISLDQPIFHSRGKTRAKN
jgi:putative oxidoreductase